MNLQIADIDDDIANNVTVESPSPMDNNSISSFFAELINDLQSSKRPLILSGRGIRASNSIDAFNNFIEKFNLPVVTSLLGFDNIQYEHPNRIGFIGTYGNRWANYALGSCDVLLVLGSRLDLRQTGADIISFKEGKKIYHVDIEEAELNNRITGCKTLRANLKDFFHHANQQDSVMLDLNDWRAELTQHYQKRKDTDELKNISGVNPNEFIHHLSNVSKTAKVITTDVGNNQMWASQSYELKSSQIFLSSGGMGAMGFSLPAAIGACFATGKAPVVAIAGDGGFQINIQELQTIRRNNLPVKIIILNNHSLGMIRQFQDSYFDSCYQSTVWGYDTPDFAKVANAYNIDAFSIKNAEDVELGLAKLWDNPTEPFLLDISLDLHTNVYPKMMFGSPITKMDPQ